MTGENNESFWRQDTRLEKELGKFLDKCFYKKLKIFYERVTDEKTQKSGVDVILGSEDRAKVDEKASFYYSNVMLPTFALELQYEKDNELRTGWYLNESLDTEYYLFVWPNIKDIKIEEQKKKKKWERTDLSMVTAEDFTIIEAMFVNRKKLKRFIDGQGLTAEYLSKRVNEIRNSTGEDRDRFIKGEVVKQGYKLMWSTHLNESPINLLVNRSILFDLAERVYLIAQDGYGRVK